jgi:hypothetical protein
MLYSIKRGLRNIVRWLPVIWHDEDYDWDYLAKVMEVKMKWMSKHFKDNARVVDSIQMSKELMICSELLRRLREDNFNGKDYNETELITKHHQEMLGNIIGKKLRHWWD